jgi:hypothetical protein
VIGKLTQDQKLTSSSLEPDALTLEQVDAEIDRVGEV